ncbi:MAG: FAD-dependent oxidoreductase [Ilumatobacteraceae bacterium]
MGGGFNLLMAMALVHLGAKVTIVHADELSQSTFWRVAAGLLEPVVTSDPAVNDRFARTLQFARLNVHRDEFGLVARRVDFYSVTAEGADLPFANAVGGITPFDTRRSDLPFGASFPTYVWEGRIMLPHVLATLHDHGTTFVRHTFRDLTDVLASPHASEADHIVIGPGMTLNDFFPPAALWAGVGVVGIIPGTPAPTAPVIMTDNLTYWIPQVTQTVVGGVNFEVEVDEWEHRSVELQHDLWDDIVDKLRDFDPAFDPNTVTRRLMGARPMADKTVVHTLRHNGGLITIVGGMCGSGWTTSIGLIEEILKNYSIEATFDW